MPHLIEHGELGPSCREQQEGPQRLLCGRKEQQTQNQRKPLYMQRNQTDIKLLDAADGGYTLLLNSAEKRGWPWIGSHMPVLS